MHYFIDGYNFLFHFYEEVDPLQRTREEMIFYLQEKLVALELKMTLVFDSHHSKEKHVPTRFKAQGIEIVYTSSKQTADQYILEQLLWNKHNHTQTVVTSDKHLATEAKALGAKVQSIESFIKKLRHVSIKKKQEYKDEIDSPEDFQRLLEAFEKRLLE